MARRGRPPGSGKVSDSTQQRRLGRSQAFSELGGTGLQQSGGFIREELLTNLAGKQGVRIYKEMWENDPIIGAFGFAVEQILRQVEWKVVPVSDDNEAHQKAQFVDSCRTDMSMTWGDVLTEILTMLPFGWSFHEVVYKKRQGTQDQRGLSSRYTDGQIGWRKIPIRSQDSLMNWNFNETGQSLLGMKQQLLQLGARDIPLSKGLLFRTKVTKNNPEGRSILRNAYRPWYFKKRIEEIEGIGIERDLAGLPVLKTPQGLDLWNPNDPKAAVQKRAAEQLIQNIRRDENEGVLLPFGWELELLASNGTRAFNTNDIVNRYDQRIAMTVLADFILLGHSNRFGSFALSKSKTSVFTASLVGYLNVIRDVFNYYEIPRLFMLNGYPAELAPRLDYGNIETPDLKSLSSFITAATGAGVDLNQPLIVRSLLASAGLPYDYTDLGGRGSTGDEPPTNEPRSKVKPKPKAKPTSPAVKPDQGNQ